MQHLEPANYHCSAEKSTPNVILPQATFGRQGKGQPENEL
jgi:hypothetical protein